MQLKVLIDAIARLTRWLENSLMALLLTTMVLLAGSQILLRNLFDSGLSWSDPTLRILVLWIGLVGAMVATRDRHHITIDLLSRFLPKTGKRISALVTDLFSAGICAVIAYHAGRFVLMEKGDGMIAFSNIPAWWCEIIIPIGFAIMAIRFFFSFLRSALGSHHPSVTDEEQA